MSRPKKAPATAKTLLLVHPQQQLRQQYCEILEQEGYTLAVANSGVEALDLIYQNPPHMVISEIVLPELNGYQLCRLLKSDPAMKRIPFILISGFDEHIDRFWGLKAGVDAYISQNQIRSGGIAKDLLHQVRTLEALYKATQEPNPLESLPANFQANNVTLPNIRTRFYQILDKCLIETTLVQEFRKLYDLVGDVQLMNHMLFSLLESVLNYDLALLHYHDQTDGKRLLSCHIPEDRLVSQEQVDRALQAYGQTLGEGFEGVDYEHECIGPLSPEAGDSPFKTVFAHRFTHHNEPIGGLMFCAKDEIRYETLFPTDWVLQELKVLMKLRHQYSLADFRAVADSQTNTYNYHYFIQALSNELKKASRFGLQVSVALIQLEEGGTESLQENPLLEVKALQAIVQQARDTFRSIDLIARYGPQTIAVLMPGTTQEQAVQPCRRLQENLQQNPLSWQGQPFSPQTRISIMSRQEEMSDPAALLHQENALILRSSSPQG